MLTTIVVLTRYNRPQLFPCTAFLICYALCAHCCIVIFTEATMKPVPKLTLTNDTYTL